MADTTQSQQASQDLSVEEQVRLGQSTASTMSAEHETFMKLVLQLIDTKQIDVLHPETFLKKEVYDALDEEWRGKTDLALFNIANLLTRIVEFRVSTHTPNESPELESMIEHLWQMKQRIEEKHDVFKF
jgi:hypothetical protein